MVVGKTDDGCEGGTYVDFDRTTHTEVTVFWDIEVKISVGKADIRYKDDAIFFFNSLRCTYTDRMCYHSTIKSTIFWELIYSLQNNFPDQVMLIYEGPVTKRVEYIVDGLVKTAYSLIDKSAELQFLLEQKEPTTICNRKAFLTQAANIHVIEQIDPHLRLQLGAENPAKSLDINVFHGLKINLVHADIGRQLEELYEQI